jgi:UDP-N-acetylmuramoyl-tripeptide--D-alanyl-D-alanine ligase
MLENLTYILVTISLGWYLITNLQWYNYKISRVVLKHHKYGWHIVYFVTPIVLFYLLEPLYFAIYFYFLYLTSFYLWYRRVDKKLVLTSRVKRFLALLAVSTFGFLALDLAGFCLFANILAPLVVSHLLSLLFEKIMFLKFQKDAKSKLESRDDLIVIAITASYGKTSIKNYLSQVLSKKYKVYQTPRSVNTLAGITKDINQDLPDDAEVYIVEAGARVKGDIADITNLVQPHYIILGTVGEQHIEYFKTLENIINTKLEIIQSKRLKKGFVHHNIPLETSNKKELEKFPKSLNITMSNLDGIWFDFEVDGSVEHFHTPVLGAFNAVNISGVILMSYELGMSIDDIKLALHDITSVDHRLELIKAGGKVILDDSFNGNLEGMLEAIKIASTHEDGDRVIVTPGLVESTAQANIVLAKAIDEVFERVIITGSLNATLLSDNISKEKVTILKDKSKLEEILADTTRSGDLVLFANDAPNFI